jgi:hypothetical protein
MKSKLIAACMALAAFAAIALPATASASPQLVETTAGLPYDVLAVGASITAKNEKETNTVFTGPFNVTCSSAHLVGTLLENYKVGTGTAIRGTIPVGGATFGGTGTSGDCTSALGSVKPTVNSELCLNTTKVEDQLEVTGCEGKVVTFSLAITGSVTCRYQTAKVLSTFTTDGTVGSTTAATVLVSEQEARGEGEGNSFICPTAGKLDMPFELSTTNGTPIQVLNIP